MFDQLVFCSLAPCACTRLISAEREKEHYACAISAEIFSSELRRNRKRNAEVAWVECMSLPATYVFCRWYVRRQLRWLASLGSYIKPSQNSLFINYVIFIFDFWSFTQNFSRFIFKLLLDPPLRTSHRRFSNSFFVKFRVQIWTRVLSLDVGWELVSRCTVFGIVVAKGKMGVNISIG